MYKQRIWNTDIVNLLIISHTSYKEVCKLYVTDIFRPEARKTTAVRGIQVSCDWPSQIITFYHKGSRVNSARSHAKGQVLGGAQLIFLILRGQEVQREPEMDWSIPDQHQLPDEN